MKAHQMMLLQDNPSSLLQEIHLLKQQAYVQLFHAFHPTQMVLPHLFPLQVNPKNSEEVEDPIAQEYEEAEVLRAESGLIILFEDTIPELYFIAVFAVEVYGKE